MWLSSGKKYIHIYKVSLPWFGSIPIPFECWILGDSEMNNKTHSRYLFKVHSVEQGVKNGHAFYFECLINLIVEWRRAFRATRCWNFVKLNPRILCKQMLRIRHRSIRVNLLTVNLTFLILSYFVYASSFSFIAVFMKCSM